MHHFAICTTLGWCKNLHTLAPPWLKEEYYAVFPPNVDSGYHSTQEAMLLLYKKTKLCQSPISFTMRHLHEIRCIRMFIWRVWKRWYVQNTGFSKALPPTPISLCAVPTLHRLTRPKVLRRVFGGRAGGASNTCHFSYLYWKPNVTPYPVVTTWVRFTTRHEPWLISLSKLWVNY